MTEPTTTLTVRLPAQLKEGLERLAESTDRSKSWLAADAIGSYIELHEWQVAEITRGVAEADRGEFAADRDVSAVFDKWAVRETDGDATE